MAEDTTNPGAQGGQQVPPAPQDGAQGGAAQQQVTKPSEIADAFLAALDARTKRVESSVTKSFAEQYGLTEDEVKSVLDAEKDKRAKQLPADVQKRIDDQLAIANNRLIAADITSKATALGCVDIDAAIALIERKDIKVDDKGAVTGTDDALKALKEGKAYLFNSQPPKAWGERQGGKPADNSASVRDEIKNQLFGGKK